MKFVIVCSGPVYARPDEWIRQALVEWYDPDYNRGEGRCQFTYDVTKAKLFGELGEAVAYAERVPVNHPFTESGMINRPIKCFEVQYRAIEVDQEKKAIESPLVMTPSAAAKLIVPPTTHYEERAGQMAIRNLHSHATAVPRGLKGE
jgi:hypothetical protein